MLHFKLSMSDKISCLHALCLVSDTTPFLLYTVLVILVIKKKKVLVISSTNSAAASMIIETDSHIGIASTQLPLPLSL